MAEGLTPEETAVLVNETIRIVTGTIHELIAVADKLNIERDSVVQHFSNVFSCMASVATFEHFDGGAFVLHE